MRKAHEALAQGPAGAERSVILEMLVALVTRRWCRLPWSLLGHQCGPASERP